MWCSVVSTFSLPFFLFKLHFHAVLISKRKPGSIGGCFGVCISSCTGCCSTDIMGRVVQQSPLSETNTLSPPVMAWWDVRSQNSMNSWKCYMMVSPGIGDSMFIVERAAAGGTYNVLCCSVSSWCPSGASGMNEVVIKLQQPCWEQDWSSPQTRKGFSPLPAAVMERMRCLQELMGRAEGRPPGLLTALFCVCPAPEVVQYINKAPLCACWTPSSRLTQMTVELMRGVHWLWQIFTCFSGFTETSLPPQLWSAVQSPSSAGILGAVSSPPVCKNSALQGGELHPPSSSLGTRCSPGIFHHLTGSCSCSLPRVRSALPIVWGLHSIISPKKGLVSAKKQNMLLMCFCS